MADSTAGYLAVTIEHSERMNAHPFESIRAMAKTHSQIQKEIDALLAQAEAARRKELPGVIAELKETMRLYGITVSDLQSEPAQSPRRVKTGTGKPRGKKAARGGAPKYADGHGNTWGGRGKRPTWLRDALAQGRQLGDFLHAQAT